MNSMGIILKYAVNLVKRELEERRLERRTRERKDHREQEYGRTGETEDERSGENCITERLRRTREHETGRV